MPADDQLPSWDNSGLTSNMNPSKVLKAFTTAQGFWGRRVANSSGKKWPFLCPIILIFEMWIRNMSSSFPLLEMIMQWEMGNTVNYYKLTPDWDCSFLFPFFFLKKHPHSHSEASAFHEKITFLCLSKFPFIYAKKSRLMPCLLFSWVWISLPAPVKWREEWNLSFLSAWLDTAGNGNMQEDPIFFFASLILQILMHCNAWMGVV